jgi:hypothetical protein
MVAKAMRLSLQLYGDGRPLALHQGDPPMSVQSWLLEIYIFSEEP